MILRKRGEVEKLLKSWSDTRKPMAVNDTSGRRNESLRKLGCLRERLNFFVIAEGPGLTE